MLIKKTYDALTPGGAFIVIENIINEERNNLDAFIFSLTMLLETNGGFNFTFADFEGWVKKVGFSKTELIPQLAYGGALIAYK